MRSLPWRRSCWLAVILAGAGCTSRITNLTPSMVPREPSGLYHFEAEWTSNQRTRQLRQADIRAFVLMEQKFYPMERVPGMTNRWEAEVPLPKDKDAVMYYFKWDYLTAGFGTAHPNSLRSQQYRLQISDQLR